MAKNNYPTLITANGNYKMGIARKKRELDQFMGTFYAYGTFASATIAWGMSVDKGATIIPMYDLSNVAITSSANDSFNMNLSTGSSLDDCIWLYATIASATGSTSIQIGYFDNNN